MAVYFNNSNCESEWQRQELCAPSRLCSYQFIIFFIIIIISVLLLLFLRFVKEEIQLRESLIEVETENDNQTKMPQAREIQNQFYSKWQSYICITWPRFLFTRALY